MLLGAFLGHSVTTDFLAIYTQTVISFTCDNGIAKTLGGIVAARFCFMYPEEVCFIFLLADFKE